MDTHNINFQNFIRKYNLDKNTIDLLTLFNFVRYRFLPKEDLEFIFSSINNTKKPNEFRCTNLLLEDDYYLKYNQYFNFEFIFSQRDFSDNFYLKLIDLIGLNEFIKFWPQEKTFPAVTQDIIKRNLNSLAFNGKLISFYNINTIKKALQTMSKSYDYFIIHNIIPLNDFNLIHSLEKDLSWFLISFRKDITNNFFNEFNKFINKNVFLRDNYYTHDFLLKNNLYQPKNLESIYQNANIDDNRIATTIIDEKLYQFERNNWFFSPYIKINENQFINLFDEFIDSNCLEYFFKTLNSSLSEENQLFMYNKIKNIRHNIIDTILSLFSKKEILIEIYKNHPTYRYSTYESQNKNNIAAINFILSCCQKKVRVQRIKSIPFEFFKIYSDFIYWDRIFMDMDLMKLTEIEKTFIRTFKKFINYNKLYY